MRLQIKTLKKGVTFDIDVSENLTVSPLKFSAYLPPSPLTPIEKDSSFFE
jgi:hypothetical protein